MKQVFIWYYLTLYVVLILVANSCTPEPSHLPSIGKYEEDTALMLNISEKFANEEDAKKLYSAAKSTQTVRLISCSDFNNECSLYGKFVSLVIKYSADGNITPAERAELKTRLAELRTAIENGKKMLREAWAKKK